MISYTITSCLCLWVWWVVLLLGVCFVLGFVLLLVFVGGGGGWLFWFLFTLLDFFNTSRRMTGQLKVKNLIQDKT